MCGIGGILRITQPDNGKAQAHEPIPDQWLDDIDARIAWRGPDGHGRFRDRVQREDGSVVEVALVHRRLSIIDHQGGHQPMVWTPSTGVLPAPSNTHNELDLRPSPGVTSPGNEPRPSGSGQAESGNVRQGPLAHARGSSEPLIAVVFNGCIYNHRELRQELETLGHTFTTDRSDTEVLIHGWREWKTGLISELQGMYAFGIWDRSQDAPLIVGRDPFGEKPLYYSDSVSEADQEVDTRLFASQNPAALDDQFRNVIWQRSTATWIAMGYGTPPPTYSSFEYPVGWIETRSHAAQEIWQVHVGTGADSLDIPSLINASINARLDADVPIATFLSGGIDSSVVTMCASDALDGNLTSICVRMPDEAYDESQYAEEVARHLGVTNHITVDVASDLGNANLDVASDFVQLIETLGLPFGDSSLLPTYWACKAAKPHAKVVLSGDGGDELFYGYERYKAATLLSILRWVPFKGVIEKKQDRSDPKSKLDKLARLLAAAGGQGYMDLVSIFPSRDLAKLLDEESWHKIGTQIDKNTKDLKRNRRLAKLMRSEGASTILSYRGKYRPSFNTAQSARAWDIANYLPGDLLRKVDTASMLAGVEVRCPLLDRAVADAALSTPRRAHMRDGRGKYILRQMLYQRLPRELVDRPKSGFAIPVGRWFREDFGNMQALMMDLFARDITSASEDQLQDLRPFGPVHDVLTINMAYIRQMLDEHWAAGGLAPLSGTTRNVRRRDHSQRLYMLCSLAIWARTLESKA